MKAICVNLPSRHDRRSLAEAEFNRVGLQVRFHAAHHHTDGRIGLQSTLLEVFTNAVEDYVDRLLVFEDDVMFTAPIDALHLALSDIDTLFAGEFDMLYLGATLIEPPKPVTNNLAIVNRALAAHAVVYNHTMFEEYIAHLHRVVLHGFIAKHGDISDVFLSEVVQKRGRSFITMPQIAVQRPSYSDIEKRYVDYTRIIL